MTTQLQFIIIIIIIIIIIYRVSTCLWRYCYNWTAFRLKFPFNTGCSQVQTPIRFVTNDCQMSCETLQTKKVPAGRNTYFTACEIFIYLAGCKMLPHLPAPIWQLYYLLPPVASVISVLFRYSLFSHQSPNPFRPGKFRSTSFSCSWWAPFNNFFWQSPLFHSLNMLHI